jgi:Family of unknown function (DUF6349)
MTGALVQLDLFTAIEEAKLEAPAPTLYGSPARGLAARAAEMTAWRNEYGGFGCLPRSHAWTVHISCPDTATERCQPTVLSADLRCDCDRFDDHCESCCCIGELRYRGACRGCDWEGDPRAEENRAAEDACDHAWPGWRDLPVVPSVPDERKSRARWVERVAALYPLAWLEDGGPIRTSRSKYGTRHVPSRTPFGGYDLAVADAQGPDTEGES